MIRIALVGEIGSGKSYYAKLFGYPVFNADREVAKIYETNKYCFNQIKKKFPKFFLKFPLKKEELVRCILANKNNIKKITKIVHPLVKKKMNFFIKKHKNKKIVILDIPLFLENKLNKKDDIIIFIKSSKKNIVKKLTKRKSYNKKLIGKFKKIQWKSEMKKKKSTITIKNNFNRKKALKDIKNILKKII
jgi:dephospho-CoA kinase